MSKLITKEINNLRWALSQKGNQKAIFEIEGKTHYASTKMKSLPSNYDGRIFVVTEEDGTVFTTDFTTPNGTVQKMCNFDGLDAISQKELQENLVKLAADVKWQGHMSFSL